MSKDQKVEAVELPKDPNTMSYRGDEIITMKASDFLKIAEAVNLAIEQGITNVFPQQIKFVEVATGKDVEEPTQEAYNNGEITEVMDVDRTFAPNNVRADYAEWLVPKVVDAKNLMYNIHAEHVKQGKATPINVIQAEQHAKAKEEHEARIKAQEKQLEELKKNAPAPLPEPKMEVVQDESPVVDTPSEIKPEEKESVESKG